MGKIFLILLIFLVGCTPSIVEFDINCSEVDCSCKLNEYCKTVCQDVVLINDQDFDRVLYGGEPKCICS